MTTSAQMIAFKTVDGWTVFLDKIIAFSIDDNEEVWVATHESTSLELTSEAALKFKRLLDHKIVVYG